MIFNDSKTNNAIESVMHINKKGYIDRGMYVTEECSELIKELTKAARGKGNRDHIIDESCDVITAVVILLRGMGVSDSEVNTRVLNRCDRAVERWKANIF